jgi:hypothetical protein
MLDPDHDSNEMNADPQPWISEKNFIFVTYAASGFMDSGESEAMLWIQIRIRIGSGFNGVAGSGTGSISGFP